MKIIILTFILLLVGCCKNPVEPEVYVDVCIDTFSPAGGTTITLRPGDTLHISISPVTIHLADSLEGIVE